MFGRLRQAGSPRRARVLRNLTAVGASSLLAASWLVAPSAAVPDSGAQPAQQQVLEWTANDSISEYLSFPTTAETGPTTIVFENSEATGNTTGMSHTLTFDISDPDYNQDVDLNILANPFDANGGRHEAEVVLSPGQYRFYCDIPGHGQMTGVLTVTDGGGDDTTPPEVTAEITGDQDENGAYIGSATVALTATDVGSGVDTIEYEIDDTGFQPYLDPVTVAELGDHSVQYRATDNAGNTSDVGSVGFTIVEPNPGDVTPPEVSAEVTGEQNADGDYIAMATVSLTATDADSGVDTIEYNLNDAGFQPYTEQFMVHELGDHTVQYRATDNSGNTSEVGSVSFTIVEPDPGDVTPPDVSAEVSGDQNDDGDYVGSATVSITATDADSGVDTIEYNLDDAGFQAYTDPVIVDGVGDHAVQYRATDNAGNVSETFTVLFTVVEPDPGDVTPPEVSAEVAGDQNDDGDYIESATVTVAASDADSGVDTIEYNLDGGGFQTYTDPVTVDGIGDHAVQYRATDNAGNISDVGTVTFTVVEPDPGDVTPPEAAADVSGSQNQDGDFIAMATVMLTATDAGSGVGLVEYDLDGAGFQPYTDPITVDEAGMHSVRYRATDNAGNVSEVGTVSFTVVADSDGCPDSDIRDTVVIGTIDTTVPNVEVSDGCTISDLIDQDGDYKSHGQFVRHVSKIARDLRAADIISKNQGGRLHNAAARSDIGR